MRLADGLGRAGALLLGVAALAAAAWLTYRLRFALLPFALGLVLAYLIEPPVRALCARGLSRTAAIIAVYVAGGALLAAAVVYLVPGLLRELDELGRTVPRLARQLQGWWRGLQDGMDRVPLPATVRQAVDQAIGQAEAAATAAIAAVVNGVMGLAAAGLSLLLAPFLAYYMLKDIELFRHRLLAPVPPRWQGRVRALLRDLDQVVGGFVRGQLLVAGIMGAAVALVAALLGMPYPLLLGVLAALGELVPYFGPVLGSLPALAVAALQSPGTLVRLVLFLVILHELEAAVLTPRILGAGVRLHPLAVVFALLAGGHLLGAFGLVMAVPAAAVLRVLAMHTLAALRQRGAGAGPRDGRGPATVRLARRLSVRPAGSRSPR